jgi:hypothetical protein
MFAKEYIFVILKCYKYTIKMIIDELRKLLDRGDYVKIARMVGYTDLTNGRRYVYKVISGRISGEKGKAKDIIDAANIIARSNLASGKTANK